MDLNKLANNRIDASNTPAKWDGKGRSPIRANVNKLFQKLHWTTGERHRGRVFLLEVGSFQAKRTQACDCGCWANGDHVGKAIIGSAYDRW